MPKRSRKPPPDRTAAIVEAALALALEGGFENVRQRDVAARAGVTLRTLYRKFPSKDDLLAVGLVRAADELDRRLAARPIRERTAEGRLTRLFKEMTDLFCGTPNLGRAVIRALTVGHTAGSSAALSYQGRVSLLVIGALRGPRAKDPPSVREIEVATLLLFVWFASVVSWSAGASDAAGIESTMAVALRHLLR
jgi:AcrR family transcriptional regulator